MRIWTALALAALLVGLTQLFGWALQHAERQRAAARSIPGATQERKP
jgi:hypothetical protein